MISIGRFSKKLTTVLRTRNYIVILRSQRVHLTLQPYRHRIIDLCLALLNGIFKDTIYHKKTLKPYPVVIRKKQFFPQSSGIDIESLVDECFAEQAEVTADPMDEGQIETRLMPICPAPSLGRYHACLSRPFLG